MWPIGWHHCQCPWMTLSYNPHQQHCRSNIVECYKSNDSFDKVETNWTCSICFDFVELAKFHEKLVRHCCRFLTTKSTVASTLLLILTGLKIAAGKQRAEWTAIRAAVCWSLLIIALCLLLKWCEKVWWQFSRCGQSACQWYFGQAADWCRHCTATRWW